MKQAITWGKVIVNLKSYMYLSLHMCQAKGAIDETVIYSKNGEGKA